METDIISDASNHAVEEKLVKIQSALSMAVAVLIAGSALAAEPAKNVSGKRHPNLAAAQRFSHQAFEKLEAAQQANEFDMDGHAQKAKELLDQANHEIKEAAEAANKDKK